MKAIWGNAKKHPFYLAMVVVMAVVLLATSLPSGSWAAEEPMLTSVDNLYTFTLANDTGYDLMVNGDTKIANGDRGTITASYVTALSTDGLYQAQKWMEEVSFHSVEQGTLPLTDSLLSAWQVTADDTGTLLTADGDMAVVHVSKAVRVLNMAILSPDPSIGDSFHQYSIEELAANVESSTTYYQKTVTQSKYMPAGWAYFLSDGNTDTQVDAVPEDEAAAGSYTLFKAVPLFTVSYEPNGGTPSPDQETVLQGGTVELPKDLTQSGYQFSGWSMVKGATDTDYAPGAAYNVTENVTAYAVYKKLYTVTVDFDDLKDAVSEEVAEGDSFIFPEAPERSGYTALGYAADERAEKPEYKAGEKLTVASDQTYYVVWEKNAYQVTWMDQEDPSLPYEVQEYGTQSAIYGDPVPEKEAPVKDGYTFVGWDALDTMPAENVTVKATWKIAQDTISKSGTYYLVKGYPYKLNGSFQLSGDPGTYSNSTFYVPESGSYTFTAVK